MHVCHSPLKSRGEGVCLLPLLIVFQVTWLLDGSVEKMLIGWCTAARATVFTRKSASALLFWGFQMQRLIGGGALSGEVLFRVNTVLYLFWTQKNAVYELVFSSFFKLHETHKWNSTLLKCLRKCLWIEILVKYNVFGLHSIYYPNCRNGFHSRTKCAPFLIVFNVVRLTWNASWYCCHYSTVTRHLRL